MKKICLIIAFIFSVICLTACDPDTYNFSYEELISSTERIELIEYENDNPKLIEVDSNTILIFTQTKMKVVEVLSSEKVSNFLLDLSTITFHIVNISAESPDGRGVRIIFKNGNFLVLSCTTHSFVAEFNEQCEFIRNIAYFADQPKYEKLLKDYFTN